MLEFEVLSSSSAGNAYLLRDGDSRIGIEAGITYRQYQRGMQFKVSALAGVLVSHSHLDHAACVKDLIKAGINCFMGPETAEALGVGGHHRIKVIEPRKPFVVGSWLVTAFELVHDVPCLGFLVESAARERLLYISDTAYCAYRFDRVTLAAIECNYDADMMNAAVMRGKLPPQVAARTIKNHLSLANCIKTLQANDLSACRHIWLLHLSNGNANETAFKAAVEAAIGIPTTVAPEKGVIA